MRLTTLCIDGPGQCALPTRPSHGTWKKKQPMNNLKGDKMEEIKKWKPKNTLTKEFTKEWESFKRNINSFPFFSAMILFTSLFLALILKIIEMI